MPRFIWCVESSLCLYEGAEFHYSYYETEEEAAEYITTQQGEGQEDGLPIQWEHEKYKVTVKDSYSHINIKDLIDILNGKAILIDYDEKENEPPLALLPVIETEEKGK